MIEMMNRLYLGEKMNLGMESGRHRSRRIEQLMFSDFMILNDLYSTRIDE